MVPQVPICLVFVLTLEEMFLNFAGAANSQNLPFHFSLLSSIQPAAQDSGLPRESTEYGKLTLNFQFL